MGTVKPTRQFALDQANWLLRKMAFQVSRSINSRDPEAVHDLRNRDAQIYSGAQRLQTVFFH